VADETCRIYEVDGEPVSVHGDKPLDEQDQAALAELVRAAKKHFADTDPHSGVIQELIAATRLAAACIPDGTIHTRLLGKRDGAEVRQRLKDAVAATRAAIESVVRADAKDEQSRPMFARITYDALPVPQVDPCDYEHEDEPELPEMCVNCRASCEDACNCPDGYQPVRVI
jgi:hypothetical protein